MCVVSTMYEVPEGSTRVRESECSYRGTESRSVLVDSQSPYAYTY